MEIPLAHERSRNTSNDPAPPPYESAAGPSLQTQPAEDFNVQSTIKILTVTPASTHVSLNPLLQTNRQAHLSVLRRFCALYNLVESAGGAVTEDARTERVARFLVCAESRYLSYLQLLEFQYASGRFESKQFSLSPWYPLILNLPG
jgi:hypothetical protein